MKKTGFLIAALRHLKPRKYISNTQLALVFTAVAVMFTANACSPNGPSSEFLSTDNSAIKQQPQAAAEIADNIKNSYARLAAERTDVCPKLVQEDIGGRVIERPNEVLVNDYCDYYLYLRRGQHLSVDVNHRQIEALLTVPTFHDFANGDYEVLSSYDKHVIRLAYDGATYKPKNLSYDVVIEVTNK